MRIGHEQIRLKVIILSALVVISCVIAPTCGKSEEISLFVRQTPDAGGATLPAAGVYTFKPDSEVTLTASPNPGYQFLYWLGDVSSPKSISTSVTLNQPKVVVAVFDKKENGVAAGGDVSFGGGGSMPADVDLFMPAGINGTGGGKSKVVYSNTSKKTPEVPEPATIILLGFGSLAVLKRRRIANQ